VSPTSDGADPYRCLELVLETTPDAAVISNLGTTSWSLIDIEDRERNFYMNGAMGLTTSTAFGLAISTDEQVTVLDGDGSLLMSLGVLSMVADRNPTNLTIVVMNNGVFETTGRQQTLSKHVDMAAVAADCGLRAWQVSSADDFADAYAAAVDHEGASLVDLAVEPSTPEDYPPLDYAHSHIKYRFRTAMSVDR
jgi:sulfopyruvate decarboxylase subunit beta